MLLLRLKFDTAYGLYRRETAMSNQTPPEPGGHGKIVTIHGGHLLVRLRRTRSIGRPPDVENWTKTVLQASLTSVFVQFSPPCEL